MGVTHPASFNWIPLSLSLSITHIIIICACLVWTLHNHTQSQTYTCLMCINYVYGCFRVHEIKLFLHKQSGILNACKIRKLLPVYQKINCCCFLSHINIAKVTFLKYWWKFANVARFQNMAMFTIIKATNNIISTQNPQNIIILFTTDFDWRNPT